MTNAAAVGAAVDGLYARLMADPETAHFFAGVDIAREPLGRLPKTVETSVYYLLTEALTNATKYRAHRVIIDCTTLRITVPLARTSVPSTGVGALV
jgi:signal transduction histidine kinase